jgi:hypothetical protein
VKPATKAAAKKEDSSDEVNGCTVLHNFPLTERGNILQCVWLKAQKVLQPVQGTPPSNEAK